MIAQSEVALRGGRLAINRVTGSRPVLPPETSRRWQDNSHFDRLSHKVDVPVFAQNASSKAPEGAQKADRSVRSRIFTKPSSPKFERDVDEEWSYLRHPTAENLSDLVAHRSEAGVRNNT